MTSWLKRTQLGIQSAPTTPAVPSAPASAFPSSNAGRVVDPNAPDVRLDVESRCIYERRLPGEAYITAHVTRLQDGFYDSPSTHGDCIDNVRFLAVSLVFHPSVTGHRFQAATVTIGLHDDTDQAFTDPVPGHKVLKEPRHKPKFLRYAPHVLFGGVSPETLDWNFNLTGSLGVSQAPASASISPSGGIKGSYKLYQMMRMQGSSRTLLARHHHEYDIEDGEITWTMEENSLQRSGLPREMTFVTMITKGDVENVVCDIEIRPKIASWFGHYPAWWNNAIKYRPLPKEHIDLDLELGQKFEPTFPGRGFNFANLAGTFNDFVSLPGTTYSLTDHNFTSHAGIVDASSGQNNANNNGGNNNNVKPASKQNTQQSQPPAPSTGSVSIQPPPRSQTVPPPSNVDSGEAPMDYHIYLHNPRTINLHATPPPPQPSTSPPAPTPAAAHSQSQSYNNYQPPVNITRPKSTVPTSSSTQPRVPSPANVKMKRRSIDITNLKNSPYYDEVKTPLRKVSEHSSSGGSLRRRRSKNDLRNAPVTEESSSTRSVSGESDSTSRSSKLSLARSASNPSSPKLVVLEAPSPPDPGVSGFKARLQAHMASEREREYRRTRLRSQTRSRDSDRLPFEVQPQPFRPPRDITPSPDPTDNPNSETTQESLVDDHGLNKNSSNSVSKPATTANSNPNPHLLDVATNTPTRRERVIVTSPPPQPPAHSHVSRTQTSPGPRRSSSSSPGVYPHSPDPIPTPGRSGAPLTNGTNRSYPRSPNSKPTSPPSALSPSSTAGARSYFQPGHLVPRVHSPYAASKWDGFRAAANASNNSNGATSPNASRPRRASSASLSPDQSEVALSAPTDSNRDIGTDRERNMSMISESAIEEEEDEQPSAGDLREEARRRARQRRLKSGSFSAMSSGPLFGERGSIGQGQGETMLMSNSLKAGVGVVGAGDVGKENMRVGSLDTMGGKGYEYITAAEVDRDWEDR